MRSRYCTGTPLGAVQSVQLFAVPDDVVRVCTSSQASSPSGQSPRSSNRQISVRSNAEIAKAIFRTEGTVKVHVKNILRKLGVNDRTAAATQGIGRGFIRRE